MKSAFHDVNRIACSIHYLNKILEKRFTDTKINELNQVWNLFIHVKQIDDHVRRCHKQ